MSKYRPHTMLPLAARMGALGRSPDDIARAFGVSTDLLAAWRDEHPQLDEAIRRGEAFANDLVENALLRRAIGGHVDVRKVHKVKKGGGLEELQVVTEEQYIPGDTGAMKFWLVNRDDERWSDKTRVENDEGYAERLRAARAKVEGT